MANQELPILIVWFVLLAIVLVAVYIVLRYGTFVVRHTEVMILERFGKYKTTLLPGLHFVVPFVDVPRKISWRFVQTEYRTNTAKVVVVKTDRIDVREHVLDFAPQHIITKDTVSLRINALVFFRIVDPRLAVYNIQDLPDAIELLTQSSLRQICARMSLDDTFSSREEINDELRAQTAADAERWGAHITRVEVMNIDPPHQIRATMESQITEERWRRATVLSADGDRESAIIRSKGNAAKMVLDSEGERRSLMQLAKGRAQAKVLRAEAEAKSIEFIRAAIDDDRKRASDFLVADAYLENLQGGMSDSAGRATSKAVLVPRDLLESIHSSVTGAS